MYMSFKTSTKVLKFTMCTCVFIKKYLIEIRLNIIYIRKKKDIKKTSIILIEFILIYIIYLERFETFVCKSVAFKFFLIYENELNAYTAVLIYLSVYFERW